MSRVRVILLNAALGPLDYRLPQGAAAEPGSIVLAPLGPRQLTGVVWDPEHAPTEEIGDGAAWSNAWATEDLSPSEVDVLAGEGRLTVGPGSGTFALGRDEGALERRRFGPGDAIFAPAGWVHRFEDFSGDFATWVVFWGPKGGEAES